MKFYKSSIFYFIFIFVSLNVLAEDFDPAYQDIKFQMNFINQMNVAGAAGLSGLEGSCFKEPASPLQTRCSPFLFDLVANPFEDRARGLVESRVQECYSEFESNKLMVSKNYHEFKTPALFQKAFEASELSRLGSFTHTVAKSCVADKALSQHVVISRFYSIAARLNLASARVSEEIVRLDKLLGKADSPCPNPYVLAEAAKACEDEKKCSQSLSISSLAMNSKSDLDIFDKTKKQLSNLAKDCKQDLNCSKNKEALSGILAGLLKKNPWFLDETYISSTHLSPYSRMSSYLKRTRENLFSYNKDLEKAALCIHVPKQEGCQVDEIRELVDKAPSLELKDDKSFDTTRLNIQMKFQACVDERSLQRDRTGEIVSLPFQVFAEYLATVALGGAGGYRAAKVTLRASKVLIPRLTALLGAEATINFVANSDTWKSFQKSCLSKSVTLTQIARTESPSVAPELQCQMKDSILNERNFEEGNCLIDGSLAALSLLPMVQTSARLVEAAKSSGYLKQAANMQRQTDLVTTIVNRRVFSSGEIGTTGLSKKSSVELKSIPHPPASIDIYEVTKVDGRKSYVFSSADKLPDGSWVQTPKEFLIDSVTGGIDATSPAGKELFEKLALSKAGAAHFAFFDVGSLGAVNREFKAGEVAGDRYLKGVAQKIMDTGEGKVTLARTGGDEFGLIIDEKDPEKIKQLLKKIQTAIKSDRMGDAKQIFFEEKVERAKEFKAALEQFLKDNPQLSRQQATGLLKKSDEELRAAGFNSLADARAPIDQIARVSVPDVSIGSSQIGVGDSFASLAERSEAAAKGGKIQSALQQGRSAAKYGSTEIPNARPNPLFKSPITDAVTSPTWRSTNALTSASPPLDGLRAMNFTRSTEVVRFADLSVAEYIDELGRKSYKSEKYVTDFKTGLKIPVLTDIPTKSSTGLLDGTHPEGQELLVRYFHSDTNKQLILPKLRSLKYLNYFESGTHAGDEVLATLADILKNKARKGDLVFKLNGADFVMSSDQLPNSVLQKRFHDINTVLANDPRIKALFEKEASVLQGKIKALKQSGKANEAVTYQQRLMQLRNFDFDLQFETLSRGEIRQNANFKEIQKTLDQKFQKRFP